MWFGFKADFTWKPGYALWQQNCKKIKNTIIFSFGTELHTNNIVIYHLIDFQDFKEYLIKNIMHKTSKILRLNKNEFSLSVLILFIKSLSLSCWEESGNNPGSVISPFWEIPRHIFRDFIFTKLEVEVCTSHAGRRRIRRWKTGWQRDEECLERGIWYSNLFSSSLKSDRLVQKWKILNEFLMTVTICDVKRRKTRLQRSYWLTRRKILET